MTTQQPSSPARTPHRRRAAPIVVAIVILAIVGAALAAIIPAFQRGGERRERRLALVSDEAVEGLSIPSFALVDQDSAPIDRASLLGHVTVMDFIFTNCPFVCPTLTQKMLYLQHELSGTDVRFLSVSVDPAHDTPERLREHAQRIGADLSRWTFATGAWDQILAISEDGLRLGLEPDPDPSKAIALPDGSTMPNILHTSRLVLIGPDGAVLGLYTGLEQVEVERLARRARLGAGIARTR